MPPSRSVPLLRSGFWRRRTDRPLPPAQTTRLVVVILAPATSTPSPLEPLPKTRLPTHLTAVAVLRLGLALSRKGEKVLSVIEHDQRSGQNYRPRLADRRPGRVVLAC